METVAKPLLTTYTAVSLAGLVGRDGVPFPLYLRTADDVWVLYHPAAAALDDSHLGRLMAEGTTNLFIRDSDRLAYFERVEGALAQVLLDRHMPLPQRADVLHGVALRVSGELLAAPDRAGVHRAQKVMMAASGLLLREPQGFAAIRRVLSASHGLASHSITVGFLAMGLARAANTDAATLLTAGLAGLLHDVGRVGYEGIDHDPEHTVRGAALLQGLGVPAQVVEAACSHHERCDGTGYPTASRGPAIPEIARIVGLVDTFETIYSEQKPRLGVFETMRVLAQTYRGCFDEQLATRLVRLFR